MENMTFYRDLNEDEKKKYNLFDKGSHRELIVTDCSFCGQQKVVYTIVYEPSAGYGDHTHRYDMKFICGGKSKEKQILCDICLSASARVDLLNDIEHKIDEARETIREAEEHIQSTLKYLKEGKKK